MKHPMKIMIDEALTEDDRIEVIKNAVMVMEEKGYVVTKTEFGDEGLEISIIAPYDLLAKELMKGVFGETDTEPT